MTARPQWRAACAAVALAALAVAPGFAGDRAPKIKVRARHILGDAQVATLLPGVKNAACPLPGTLTGGQIDSAQVWALKRAGVRVVLDMRTPGEPRGFDEAGAMRAAGLRYVTLPVGHDSIPDSTFDAVRAWLRDTRDPALVHCGSGNRVGAAMIPALVLDRGLSPDSALALARRIGMRGEGLRESAMRYLERRGPVTR